MCCFRLGFSQCNIVVSNTNDAGAGSFRQAIIDANACATTPTITFTISSGSTINLLSDLPAITKANLTINGTTATGFAYPNSMVTINWQNRINCLQYNAGANSNVLKGLIFYDNYLGNGDAAIRVSGGDALLVNQCRSYNSRRNFVRVLGGTNVKLRQNQCDNFSNDVLADAVEANSGSLIELSNSTFTNIPRRIFEMNGTANGGTSGKVAFRNNTITNVGYEDGSSGQKGSHIFSSYTDHTAVFSVKNNSVNSSSSKFIDLLNTNGQFSSLNPRDSIYGNTILNVKGINTIYVEQYSGNITYGGVIIYNNTLTGTGIGLDPIDQVILIKGWSGQNYIGAQVAYNFITNYHGSAILCSYSDNTAIQDNAIYNCSDGALVEMINDCDNASIFNNFFGTDYSCVSGLSLSQGSTVELTDCDNCSIGGSRGQCKGNVIVASVNNGSRRAINVASNCEGTTLIQGNYINVSKDQGECISTSSSQAVYAENSISGSKITIGGDSLNMRNDICGGTNGTGIDLNFQQTTSGNLIQGNLIGCRSSGCPINGNDLLYGIRIQGLTGATTIGWGNGTVTQNLINKIGYCGEAIRNENRPNITWGGVLCWRNTDASNIFFNNGAAANGGISAPTITSVNVTTGVINGTSAGGMVDVYLWDGPLSPQLGYSNQGYKFLGRVTGSPWTLNLGTPITTGDIAAYQINGTSSSGWSSFDVSTQGPYGNLICSPLNMPCWQAGGCTIPIPYAPTISSIVQPTCSVSTGTINISGLPSSSNWSMTVSPSGNIINGSGSTYILNTLNPGTYNFTVSIASGACISSTSLDANVLSIPGTPTVGTITQPTCSTTSGSVILNGLPAIGNWTITASPGGATISGTGTSTTFGNLSSGNYSFVVTNGTCPSNASQNVLINSAPISPSIPTISTTSATCSANGTASISNFTAGQTYVFSPSGPTVSAGTISGLTAGTNYTVTAGNGSCTSAASSSFNIATQLTTPSIPTTSTTSATCSANGTASISNFTAGQTYVFSPSGPTVSAGTINGMTAGTNYTVTAGNGSCTSAASSSFNITAQLSTPNISLTPTNPSSCNGSDGNILISGSGNGNITWSGTSSGSISSISLNSSILNLSSGNYSVYFTDGISGCQSAIVSTSLYDPNSPLLDPINNISTCLQTYTLQSITGSNLVDPHYFTLPNGAGTSYSPNEILTAPLSITLYAFDNNGGCSNEQSFHIQLNQLPIILLNATAPSACDFSDGTIVVSGTGTGTLVYSGNAADSILSVNLNYSITNLISGNYSVYFIDQSTGCQSNTLFTDLINPNAPIITNPGNFTTCDSFTLPSILGTNLSSNATYWTQPGGNGTQFNIGDQISNSITLYAFDQTGNCTDDEMFEVIINSTPIITNPGSQTACSSYSLPSINGVNLSSSEAFYNNSQSNGGVAINGSITSSQTIYIFDNNNNCTFEDSFNVVIHPLPTATISGGASYCQGDSISSINVNVVGTSNYILNYTLNGNLQSQSFVTNSFSIGNTAGIYSLLNITDANCTNSNLMSTQTIIINPIPNPPIAGFDTTYCKNETPIDLSAQGIGIITWYSDSSLSSILTTGSNLTPLPLMNLGTTNYYVTETINNCESQSTIVTISVNGCDIIIPTAITPDNDGVNETWVLENIDEIYPKNVVSIYNRWGTLIYQSKEGNYEAKPWNGKYIDENMPVGSYYFLIEFNESNTENKSGIVSILK